MYIEFGLPWILENKMIYSQKNRLRSEKWDSFRIIENLALLQRDHQDELLFELMDELCVKINAVNSFINKLRTKT